MRNLSIALLVTSLAACEGVSDRAAKQDTTVATPGAPGERAANAPVAAPLDSLTRTAPGADSALVVHPAQPRRGGALVAVAPGVVVDVPRCTWRGAPIPCHRATVGGSGVRVVVPLPADEPAGTYTLTIERPGGRITRQVAVADREFARELVFLDSARYALLRRGGELVRDARALRRVLSAESAEPRWSGGWREPVRAARTSPYGVERFYYPAADSARAISIAPSLATRGSFAVDTIAPGSSEVPGWRHAGVDLAVAERTAVLAPADGLVADVGEYLLSGRTLVIDHGQGVHSAYFHLDSVTVRKGELVRAGAQIARSGNTGLTTGPHLHYAIYVHGKDVDPAAWRDLAASVLADSAVQRATSKE